MFPVSIELKNKEVFYYFSATDAYFAIKIFYDHGQGKRNLQSTLWPISVRLSLKRNSFLQNTT